MMHLVKNSSRPVGAAFLLAGGLLLTSPAAQAAEDEEAPFMGSSEISDELLEARKKLAEAAEARRRELLKMTFEEFRESLYKEPGENGKFIVNGDTAIANEKQLREYFARLRNEAANSVDPKVPELAVITVGGLDAIWSQSERRALSYCVSLSFGSRYQQTVEAMRQAATAWEAAADLKFIHRLDQDASCTPNNTSVVFDVRPVSGGRYLARAFFPHDARPARNVLIDDSSYTLDPMRKLSLRGILRHELGHVIGIRHEHTRPDSGTCHEDDNWRPVTDYDAFSVMHYPQCNGQGDWSLTLTHLDRNGIACLYGPAAGFTIDPTVCQPPGAAAPTQTLAFEDITVAANKDWEPQGLPVPVKGGSEFSAVMSGTGDPDLYLKFDTPASRADYDCRPYTDGADEKCVVDVPAGASRAYVMVRGYEAATFNLAITYMKP
ncbi:matrixin [Hoeflea halophila]|uniref:Matrixin n=1 Tax=Hoeflea halophila TaxID=714899 RepID=A0A286IE04_9HYPH|nr:matrixin family metalloprotease [Hoeflea halophila]SOE18257.1 matrixin [Hoeflea halophila]